MTEEDEEFNRIEREASLRMAAVTATVAKREWVSVADTDIDVVSVIAGFDPAHKIELGLVRSVVRAIEAKLKEKNAQA